MNSTNCSNFGWHSTFSAQLGQVAARQRRDERNADEQVSELLADVEGEWRVMVKDVRFAMHGGVDSPARRMRYTARRIGEARRTIARKYAGAALPYAYRCLDEALGAVEMELS